MNISQLNELIKKPSVTFAELEQIDTSGIQLELIEYERFGVHLQDKDGKCYRGYCYTDKNNNYTYQISLQGNLNFKQDLIVKNNDLKAISLKNMYAAIFLYKYKLSVLNANS